MMFIDHVSLLGDKTKLQLSISKKKYCNIKCTGSELLLNFIVVLDDPRKVQLPDKSLDKLA